MTTVEHKKTRALICMIGFIILSYLETVEWRVYGWLVQAMMVGVIYIYLSVKPKEN